MSILHVTKENFQSLVLESNKPVLVDFWAAWCGPCRMIAPVLEEVAAQRPDVQVCKADVDQQQELAMEYGVSSIPTLLVFRGGKVVSRSVGVVPKAKILEML